MDEKRYTKLKEEQERLDYEKQFLTDIQDQIVNEN